MAAQYSLTQRNAEIRDNFDAIAPRYDLTNRILSLGIDRRWRRLAVRRLRGVPADGLVLDLACGTCDMTLEILKQRRAGRVVGTDLSPAMLRLAREKVARRGARAAGRVDLVHAPAEALPFQDGRFDAVTIAFGIRNVPDHRAGLAEIFRVLKPGGTACILEFSTPRMRLLSKPYHYYFFSILPILGGLVTRRQAAYRYLTESVARFPDAGAFGDLMAQAGFRDVQARSMSGGIVCVHTGLRP